jgi:predicted phosphatase
MLRFVSQICEKYVISNLFNFIDKSLQILVTIVIKMFFHFLVINFM